MGVGDQGTVLLSCVVHASREVRDGMMWQGRVERSV